MRTHRDRLFHSLDIAKCMTLRCWTRKVSTLKITKQKEMGQNPCKPSSKVASWLLYVTLHFHCRVEEASNLLILHVNLLMFQQYCAHCRLRLRRKISQCCRCFNRKKGQDKVQILLNWFPILRSEKLLPCWPQVVATIDAMYKSAKSGKNETVDRLK